MEGMQFLPLCGVLIWSLIWLEMHPSQKQLESDRERNRLRDSKATHWDWRS